MTARACPGIHFLRREHLIYELNIRGQAVDGTVTELAARLRAATIVLSADIIADPATLLMLGDDRAGLDDTLKEFIDVQLRELLQNLNVSLDPLYIGDLSPTLGNANGENEPLKLELQDINVHDLLKYETYNASYSFVGFRISVAVNFPEITLTGKYKMDGWLGDGLLYLFGEGDLTLSLIDTSLYVELALGSHNVNDTPNVVHMNCLALDYNVGGAKSNLTGLLGDEELGDFFNAVLEDALPTILNLAEDTLLGKATCFVKNLADDLLEERQITMNDLLCFIGVGFGCNRDS